MQIAGRSRKGLNMMSATKQTLLCIWIAMCAHTLYGQVDAIQYDAKYGPPVENVFRVRPNVVLAVSYGDKRQICKLELRPLQYDGVIKLALIDELVNEIIPPLAHGAVAPKTGSVCMGFCFRLTEYSDFLVVQPDQDVSVSQHNFGEGWFAVVQFKACLE
jgi:hypothetical protein